MSLPLLNQSPFAAPELIILIIGLVITVLIFLAIRAIMLWYWRINEIIANQQKTNLYLEVLLNELRKKPPQKEIRDPALYCSTFFSGQLRARSGSFPRVFSRLIQSRRGSFHLALNRIMLTLNLPFDGHDPPITKKA